MKYYDENGCRLTDCCRCYSVYMNNSSYCEQCHQQVAYGEGDTCERQISKPLEMN